MTFLTRRTMTVESAQKEKIESYSWNGLCRKW